MARLRSKPIALAPVRNPRSGTLSYRVTGTLRPGGKQQKEVFGTLEAAESCRDSWESVRVTYESLHFSLKPVTPYDWEDRTEQTPREASGQS